MKILDTIPEISSKPLDRIVKDVDLLKEKRFSDGQMIDITTPEDPSTIVIAKNEVQ